MKELLNHRWHERLSNISTSWRSPQGAHQLPPPLVFIQSCVTSFSPSSFLPSHRPTFSFSFYPRYIHPTDFTPHLGKEVTHQIVKAKNKLPGPPLIKPLPICTNNAVPIVPPMPISWICLGFSLRCVESYTGFSFSAGVCDHIELRRRPVDGFSGSWLGIPLAMGVSSMEGWWPLEVPLVYGFSGAVEKDSMGAAEGRLDILGRC
jgi:hypothetical protein